MVVQQISTRINDAVVYRYSKLFETIVYISSSIQSYLAALTLPPVPSAFGLPEAFP